MKHLIRKMEQTSWGRPLFANIRRILRRLPWRERQIAAMWDRRTLDVLASPDLKNIRKVDGAGLIQDDLQTMHNGLRIYEGSYYGVHCSRLLERTGGVHEPQEEYIFQEVLSTLKEGSVMVEVGAFWGFYSMWFHQVVPDARNILVEPQEGCLNQGKRNFALNGMEAEFIQAYVGVENPDSRPPTLSVDRILRDKDLEAIQLLHADIQGAELDMLKGLTRELAEKKIGVLFISTHSDILHRECENLLNRAGYTVHTSLPQARSYSTDGLLVAFADAAPPSLPAAVPKPV